VKKPIKKLQNEILFYARKLPPIKQMEALDFIKWLWGGPSKNEEEFTEEEWGKIISLKKDKGRAFKSGKELIGHLKGLMKK